MRLNKKGQALIEFVILMPIFILIFFGIVDFGRIYYTKIELQSKMNDVVDMTKNKESFSKIEKLLNKDSDNNINLSMIDNNDERTIKLESTIKLYTPGIDSILSNPYTIKISRTIIID